MTHIMQCGKLCTYDVIFRVVALSIHIPWLTVGSRQEAGVPLPISPLPRLVFSHAHVFSALMYIYTTVIVPVGT